MGKLTAFNFITLNGFYKGANNDISWHIHGEDQNQYSVEMLQQDNILLFGRVTYEMMQGYWSSDEAIKQNPEVANRMNSASKIVFSKTLDRAEWNNTQLMKSNIIDEVKKLKHAGNNLALLGSGNILTQFAEAGIVDEYQIMIDPTVIGEGATLFKGISRKLELKYSSIRTFKSGAVVLYYQPLSKT